MIRQRKPIKRSKPPRRRRTTPRRSERLRDQEWLLAVKRLHCCAASLGECWGTIEADHAGKRPAGRKCSDNETIPLCQLHHAARHGFSGAFHGWDRARMRQWLDSKISDTQTTVTANLAGVGGVPW